MATSTRAVIDAYYQTANAGNWRAWCDLFTDDMIMDEQLAGHIEGLAKLRQVTSAADVPTEALQARGGAQ